jgi:hypothetical protein
MVSEQSEQEVSPARDGLGLPTLSGASFGAIARYGRLRGTHRNTPSDAAQRVGRCPPQHPASRFLHDSKSQEPRTGRYSVSHLHQPRRVCVVAAK